VLVQPTSLAVNPERVFFYRIRISSLTSRNLV